MEDFELVYQMNVEELLKFNQFESSNNGGSLTWKQVKNAYAVDLAKMEAFKVRNQQLITELKSAEESMRAYVGDVAYKYVMDLKNEIDKTKTELERMTKNRDEYRKNMDFLSDQYAQEKENNSIIKNDFYKREVEAERKLESMTRDRDAFRKDRNYIADKHEKLEEEMKCTHAMMQDYIGERDAAWKELESLKIENNLNKTFAYNLSKEKERYRKSVNDEFERYVKVRNELDDLKERMRTMEIETNRIEVARAIDKLLNPPPKEETALDVLNNLEKYCAGSDRPVTEGLAKLRKHIEKQAS